MDERIDSLTPIASTSKPSSSYKTNIFYKTSKKTKLGRYEAIVSDTDTISNIKNIEEEHKNLEITLGKKQQELIRLQNELIDLEKDQHTISQTYSIHLEKLTSTYDTILKSTLSTSTTSNNNDVEIIFGSNNIPYKAVCSPSITPSAVKRYYGESAQLGILKTRIGALLKIGDSDPIPPGHYILDVPPHYYLASDPIPTDSIILDGHTIYKCLKDLKAELEIIFYAVAKSK